LIDCRLGAFCAHFSAPGGDEAAGIVSKVDVRAQMNARVLPLLWWMCVGSSD
jgi:hypothetical protein